MKLASQVVHPIKPSITLAVTAKAAKLKAAGHRRRQLRRRRARLRHARAHQGRGQEGAGQRASASTPQVDGTLPLRKAVADRARQAPRLRRSSPTEVIVSLGAKHSLYNLFMALLDEGDEVIIPAPYWVSYPDMVKLAGGRPVDRARPGRGRLRGHRRRRSPPAITPRTRAIVLNSPSNPTGAIYDARRRSRRSPSWRSRRTCWSITDDIYRPLVYGDAQVRSIADDQPRGARARRSSSTACRRRTR